MSKAQIKELFGDLILANTIKNAAMYVGYIIGSLLLILGAYMFFRMSKISKI